MTYRVEVRPAALRQLRALTAAVRQRLQVRIDQLAQNPRPAGAKRLVGPQLLYRLRVGDYRVIYAIDDRARIVTVTTAGHRRDVYR